MLIRSRNLRRQANDDAGKEAGQPNRRFNLPVDVTQPQAQRLWGLDEATCRLALDSLVGAGFLRRTDAGQYVRLTEGPATAPPLRMAKAAINEHARRIAN